MSNRFLTDSDALVEFIETNRQVRDAQLQEAVAEALFRLGVHPAIPAKDRFSYLFQAYKRDSTNPKYAYHLGRLYFLYGDLDKAGAWLRTAARLCPTSHRIWTHIHLLHREINLQYTGNTQYEPDALKKRGRRIAEKIKKGQDDFEADLLDFKPPRSQALIESEKRRSKDPSIRPLSTQPDAFSPGIEPLPVVARITNKGVCRWSGIHDLELEMALEDSPSNSRMMVLYPLLRESLTELSKRRANGLSAFGLLAIEWLIAGYPVKTIERFLAEMDGLEKSPTLDLLKIVCQLYEVDEATLPGLLAQHTENGSLPPLLTALIHRQRLLWRDQEFQQLSSYTYARQLLQQNGSQRVELEPEQMDELEAHRKEMEKFLRALRNPVAPKVLEDIPSPSAQRADASGALSTTEIIEQLNALADRLTIQLDQYGERVREILAAKPAGPYTMDEQALGGEVRLDLLKTDKLRQMALDEIEHVRDSGRIDGEVERLQLDDVQVKYRNLRTGVLRKKLKAFGMPEITPEERSQAENTTLFNLPSTLTGVAESHASLNEELSVLDQQADEITARLDDYWKLLAEVLPTDTATPIHDREWEQANELRAYLGRVENLIQISLSDLEKIRESGLITSEEQRQTRDRVQEKYQKIQLGKFKKKLKKLNFGNAPIQDGGTEAYASSSASGDGTGMGASALKSDSGSVPTLHETLAAIDTEIDRVFASINDTFHAYSISSFEQGPLQSLYFVLQSRQAESYYRMGRQDKARSIWNSLVQVDRLSAATLKNIAVSNMENSEVGQTLAAWRAYCEVLYIHAVIVGAPNFGAKERAEFHQSYASAFLPPDFGKTVDSQWYERLDKTALISFLQSPARLRSFIDHTLLSFFNRKLDFLSPTLILGVDRNEPETTRLHARKMLEAYTQEISEQLPERTARAFASICNSFFDAALTSSKIPASLTLKRDPNYASEKDHQLHWVIDLLKLLYKFYLSLTEDKEVAAAWNSFECLEQLDRLAKLPVRLSPSFLGSAAQHMGIGNVDEFLGFFEKIKQPIVASILTDLFAQNGEQASRAHQHQYRQLVEHWIKQPFLAEFLDLIDDPQPFYSPAIRETLQTGKSTPTVLDDLRRWHKQYPQLSGPARYLAILLTRQGQLSEQKLEEIKKILKAAADQGLTQKGREECLGLLTQIEFKHAIDTNDYKKAIKYAREMLKSEPENVQMLEQLLVLYEKWIDHSPAQGISLIPQIFKDFDNWQKQVGKSSSDETIKKASSRMDEITVFAAMVNLQVSKTPSRKDLEQSLDALSGLLERNPANMQAIYGQMTVCWRLVEQLRSSSRDEACHYATRAETAADRLLAESQQPRHQQDGQAIKEQVKALRC